MKKDYEVVKCVKVGGKEYGPPEVLSFDEVKGDRLVRLGFLERYKGVEVETKKEPEPTKPGGKSKSTDGL